jgi:hypothetical protein
VGENVKDFTDRIMRISAPSLNVFGSGLPGQLGRSAGVQGSTSPGAQILDGLKQTAADFYAAYKADDQERLKESAKGIEGQLLAAQTISVISQKDLEVYMDKLDQIMKESS